LISLEDNTANVSASVAAAVQQGCCLVDVDGYDTSQTLDNMWVVIRNQVCGERSSFDETMFRNETLGRTQDTNEGGYDYVHFGRNEMEQEQRLQNVTLLQASFDTLFQIARAYTTLCLIQKQNTTKDIDISKWTGSGMSFQRFARYRPPNRTLSSH